MAKKELPLILPHDWVNSLEESDMLEAVTASSKELKRFWKQQDFDCNLQFLAKKRFWQKLDLERFLAILAIVFSLAGCANPTTCLCCGCEAMCFSAPV